MSYSVLLPFVPRRPAQVLPYAGLVSWTRAERLWQGQSMLIEPFQGFASAAGTGFRVPTGIGVTLMPLRHPFDAAQSVQSLALTTGESVLAGFGPGARSFQQSLLGAPYASPLTASREYLQIVRGLLSGEPVEVDGEYFTCHGALPRMPTAPIELGLGVLRPGMAQLAGEVADAAITWLTPARYLADTIRPALDKGAETAGCRPPKLVAMVPLALRAEGRDPHAMVLAGSQVHMQGPHYIDMLARAGIDIAGMDRVDAALRMVEGGAFLYGDLDELQDKLNAYFAAGVDEVIFNTVGLFAVHGHDAVMSDLKTLLTGLELPARAATEEY